MSVLIPDRLIAKLNFGEGECWLWTGAMARGYGQVKISGKVMYVHRVVYELLVGPIPEGLTLDHLKEVCTSRACCNPDHLEPVTQQVNILRGDGLAAREAAQTECKRGHPYNEVNTRITKRGSRQCRVCKRDRERSRDKTCQS